MRQPLYTAPDAEMAPTLPTKLSDVLIAFPEEEVEQSIPDRFDKIVRQCPDHVAIKSEDDVVTYAELNAMANRVARTVLKQQIAPSLPVAILLGKVVEQISAMLGVLKAGKFFVLLDPEFPQSRITTILFDSGSRLVISDRRQMKAAASDDIQIIVYESIDDSVVAHPPRLAIPPGEFAYLTYTSGSTGQPKGVIQTHRNLIHRVMQHGRICKIGPHDQVALLNFRASNAITTSFYGLLNGATLCAFDVKKEGVPLLTTWLTRESITVCFLGATLFRSLCRILSGSGNFPDLRFLKLRSESACQSDVNLFKKYFSSNCNLVHSLSSSETGTLCDYVVPRDKKLAGDELPVGYAAKDKDILLLDDEGRELGPNEVGEIVVRSRYLSPGYWRRPDLTEMKFKVDPHDPEQRLCYTGDLGLMLSDGCLIHKGRKDFRAKIRGYGVEIEEVVKVLRNHAAIRDAVVVTRQNDVGEARLVGYFTSSLTVGPTTEELRKGMGECLPDYMIPSHFIRLDEMPFTSSGKVDRQALPDTEKERPVLSMCYVPPKSLSEKKLAQIWGEVLQLGRVGLDDNFFDLGGHSLAGAEIIARVKEEFGVELPVSRLLDSPTVAQMAELLSHGQMGKGELQALTGQRMPEASPTLDVRSVKSFTDFSNEEVEQSIPARFEKIVRLYPDRIAVKAGNQIVSYSELNAMANRIGHSIVAQRGTVPEPVGLLIEKGVEQIAAMLGILKAGKFVVPLDPSYPLERMSSVLQDSRAAALIIDRRTISIASQITAPACQLIRFEAADHGTTDDNVTASISPHALACLVYTSGSTGKPKGVIRDHRTLLHGAMLRALTDGISSNDRLAHITAGTANAVTNSFYVLLQGATLVAFDVKQEGVARLASWLADEKITVCLIASPVFRKLCAILTGSEEFPDLRYLRLRSDTVYKSDVELHRKHFPPTCSLANGLASSETGPLREFRIYHHTEFDGSEVPVGYALRDKEILLLNDIGEEVGFNEIGEIVVRSQYLSNGYWNDPELTATKFKPDPNDAEKRLFYTGDLGLMLPDGCLIHKGRKDFRVKIHGYGVDLVEIEKTLLSYRGLKEVVVVSRNDGREARLVAYYTLQAEPSPTVSDLRRYLQKTLAEYMIPSIFIKLETMPLTSNGKINRQVLPDPGNERPNLDTAFVAPVSRIEEQLTRIWLKVLSLNQVGVHDNFFDLGGNSLLGARLVSLIHEAFHMDLPVSEFFAAPTIAHLAKRIEPGDKREATTGKKAWTYLCELQRGNGRRPVFVFPGGGGGEPEFFVYGFLARHVGAEYPFYGLRARGADGRLQPHTSVMQMADAYVEEIRAIQPEGPYFLVGECAGGVNAYEAARQLSAQGQEIAMLVLMDVERPTLIKYFRFRANRVVEPVTDIWNDKVCGWLRENYYLARIPYHLKQLRSLKLGQYPGYFRSRTFTGSTPPKNKPRPMESRRERAAIVLYSAASGEALRHIERVRENYRRVVRRFRPKPYDGHIEILVSEKLYRHDPTLGWKKLALKGLSIHPLPGDHWSYIRDHVAAAGPQLTECLERAERNPGSCSR